MKKALLCSIILICGLFVITCKKDKKSKPGTSEEKSGFTVMANGTDPLIVSYAKSSKEKIDFYGLRDNKGSPSKINMVIVQNNADTTIYKLDDLGRPVDVVAPNGTKFEFNWIAAQKAALTIISGDGLNQLNTEIDFTSKGKSKSVIKTNSPRQGDNARIQFVPYSNLKLNAKAPESTTGNVTVNVTACGLPTDGEVAVHLKDKSGNNLGYFPATKVNQGTYVAQVPTDKAPKLNLADVCEEITGVMEVACWANDVPNLTAYMCPAIALAVSTSGIGALFAGEITAACLSVTAGLELYCGTIGASGAPGAPSLADMICGADIMNRTFTEDIYIYATVAGLPTNAYSQFKLVSEGSTFPALDVAMSSKTTIRKLTLDPSSPAAYQGYTATADIYCLQTGSTVKMDVVGTDGYQNSQVTAVSANQQSGLFNLWVPGGASQVEDKITLTIKLPDGSALTRTAQLVFN